MLYFCMILSVFFSFSSSCDDDGIFILKSNGSTIVGRKILTVFENKPYTAFWKVPYAEAPVKELRFKPPKIHQVWLDQMTYDFSRPFNNTCSSGLTEDCLYLSIYMPISEDITSIPVMVWIHEHSNLHEPDFLIDEDILVVTVSYRTSILGFLNTGDDFAHGNMGAKDIITALKWIRENILLFNGDVNRVTVIGSGTSANLVASLLLSNSADDLFTRVVIQSGSALHPGDYRNHILEILKKLYKKLNEYDKVNRKKLYNFLSNATVKELNAISQDLFDSTEVRDNQRLINSFGPTLEASKHAFMNKLPIEVYKRGLPNNNVPVMIGYASFENLYKLKGIVNDRKLLKYLNYNFQYLLPFEGASDEYGSKRYRKIARTIKDFYFVNGTIGERSLRRYAKYISDQVIYPLLRQANIHTSVTCENVYLYRFAFKGSFNVVWDSRLNYTGATTGDEICYQFRCKSLNGVYKTAEAPEREFIKKIARLWANFAKCGNPTPTTEDNLLRDLQWQPLDRHDKMRALNLGKKIKMRNIPEEKRMKFWDELKDEFFPDRFKDEL